MRKKAKYNLLFERFGSVITNLTIVIAVAMACSVSAQENLPRDDYFNSEIKQHQFDQEQWESITEELNYLEFEIDDDENITDQKQNNQSSTNHSGSNNSSRSHGSPNPFWVGFFKVLAVLIATGVVAILLIHLIGGGALFAPKSKKIPVTDQTINIEEIEANIHESDLDRHIRAAMDQKNYALVLRLYYLAIIKELSLSKRIKWKRDKTNKDYLSEMRDSNLFKPYREVTRIFERAWYGQTEIDEPNFQKLKPQFVDLINQAKKVNT